MKFFSASALLFISLILCSGCAHHPESTASLQPSASVAPQQSVLLASNAGPFALKDADTASKADSGTPSKASTPQPSSPSSVVSSPAQNQNVVDDTDLDYVEESNSNSVAKISIADPLEPFNRAMFYFNDKLYFWLLKPVAQGYNKVVPETARIGVKNFFSNLTTPIRLGNCLLQANLGGAVRELGRFMVNTTMGLGGFMDPASGKNINVPKQDADFGQTLGIYGLGQGFFINWPILGPSSPRDTVGTVGDTFMHPLSYLVDWEVSVGIRAYEKVNDTSLSIGDYESLKEAAIDPYIALRDAYVQYRLNKVKSGGEKSASPVKSE